MTSLSITIHIDVGADLDEATLSAIIDGVRGLQTRLQLADREPLTQASALAPVAAIPAAEPAPAPAEDATVPAEADAPPCKIAGCTEPSVDRRGMYGRLCVIHKAEKSQHRKASLVHVRQPATVPHPATVPQPARAGGGWCEYCQADRTQLHVDQHELEVKREQARQDEARAGISHLSRPTGVGGAA